jgi:UDP-N-acetylmuramyl pentapeptide phosphotransferase/UDP-N-acetylglucosamine-1-phosphate transferase
MLRSSNHQSNANNRCTSHYAIVKLCVVTTFPFCWLCKKKRRRKKKEEEMTHGNKMNLFLSNPLKMIEACVYVSIISSYYAELLNIFTCECLLLILWRSTIRIIDDIMSFTNRTRIIYDKIVYIEYIHMGLLYWTMSEIKIKIVFQYMTSCLKWFMSDWEEKKKDDEMCLWFW